MASSSMPTAASWTHGVVSVRCPILTQPARYMSNQYLVLLLLLLFLVVCSIACVQLFTKLACSGATVAVSLTRCRVPLTFVYRGALAGAEGNTGIGQDD